MEWNLSQFLPFGKSHQKSVQAGKVGICETSNGFAVVYGVQEGTDVLVKAYSFEKVEDLSAKQALLTQFVTEHHLQGVACSYVLGAGEYSLNLMDAPAVAKEERIQALRWIVRDLINFSIEEAVIDAFDLPFTRAKDNVKMLYAAVVRKSVVTKIETLIGPSGLTLAIIDIPELVLGNIIARYPKGFKGCAFIQLNPKSGKLVLYREGTICVTRSFELTLDELGKDVEQDNKTLESLALEIQRSFDYMSSIFRQNIQNIIILAPTLVDNKIISEFLKNSLGLEVNFLKLSECLTFEHPMTDQDEANCLLAVGATLREEETRNETTN